MKNKNGFSVALGLTDYVNPILYAITCSVIIMNIKDIMFFPYSVIYVLGVVISIIFGLSIPTLKLLVGLGKVKFSLPVNLVFYVNSGIFLSGLMLIKNILNIGNLFFGGIILLVVLALCLIYLKTKKFNNVAVLIGAVGYFLIYVSLINKSLINNNFIPVLFYGFAICLYLMLIFIGLKGNLKNANVHWGIEISNIICQMSVMVGTILLFG